MDLSKAAGKTGELVTFIDIDEDGRLDLLLQKTTNGKPEIVILYNNIVSDSFFLKALAVNSKLSKNNNFYGNNGIGTSYRFVVTDLDDNKYVSVGAQTYQSGYMSLQLPYSFLGIGRSNNYVENFYAACSVNGKRAVRMWTPIIPNSQLIIFVGDAMVENWGLELFINPT